MRSYFDSSALVAIYSESFSKRARREARAAGQLPYTSLHEIEVHNALYVLHGRGLLDPRELLGQLDEDLETNRLVDTRLDLFEVFRRARDLSRIHSAQLLCRSLDVLHVAAALVLRCSRLVSGDDRQLALAAAVGLDPVDVKTSRRARKYRGR